MIVYLLRQTGGERKRGDPAGPGLVNMPVIMLTKKLTWLFGKNLVRGANERPG